MRHVTGEVKAFLYIPPPEVEYSILGGAGARTPP